jgi:hypothetical protein
MSSVSDEDEDFDGKGGKRVPSMPPNATRDHIRKRLASKNENEAAPTTATTIKDHDEALELLSEVDAERVSAESVLEYARGVAQRSGLTVDLSIVNPAYQAPLINANSTLADGQLQPRHFNDITTQTLSENATRQTQLYGRMRGGLNAFPLILETTGGHSNTDHIIATTGVEKLDKVAEYKRALIRRSRAMRPEEKGDQRWDQPRIKGSRRRRILRQKDLPTAPPEPPSSGYVLFVAQMTAKMRHDRGPEVTHNQIEAVGEISRMWKYDMTDADRVYYVIFAREAKAEYLHQLREFRATGSFRPSKKFEKLLGDGPSVRLAWNLKNDLEKELATYKEIVKAERTIFKEEKRAKITAAASAAVVGKKDSTY